jgi:hypothetical protein
MPEIALLMMTLIIITILIFSKEKHTFWDEQPVMRTYNNRIGIIGMNNKFDIKLKDPDLNIEITNDNFEKVFEFLDRNFSNNFNISYPFFKHIYNMSHGINITLYKGPHIIGFIHSHPIKVRYNDKVDIEFMYVDYLCIETKFRNQNAAVVLISSLINQVSDPKMPFIFKKDSYPLPFCHILKSNYYYCDMRNNSHQVSEQMSNVKCLSMGNIEKYFQYTNDLINRYHFRKLYEYNEFKRVFLDEKILEYYIVENTNTGDDTIVIGKKNKYDWLGEEYISFDVDIILGDLQDCKKIWNELLPVLTNKGYNFITIPHIASNIVFIYANNFQKANSFYYYTYNFELPLIDNHEFCFNLN